MGREQVLKVQVIMDPHTRESRGFGFVEMANGEDADKAIEKLRGEQLHGRSLLIEKAKRKKPRTSTPGQYFGKGDRTIFICFLIVATFFLMSVYSSSR